MTRPNHICDLILSAAASDRRDEPAFIFPESTLTWAEMERDIRMIAGTLHKIGVQPGDNIAVILPNLPLHPILAFAAPWLGAVYLPIDANLPNNQLARLLRNPVPAAVFVQQSRADELKWELGLHDMQLPIFPVDDTGFIVGDQWPRDAFPWAKDPQGELDSIAVRRHTSGVSQEHQLVPLTHANLLSATESVRKTLQVLSTSVLYGTHPFWDSFGFLFQMLLPAWAMCTLQTCRRWSAQEVAGLLRDTDITAYIGTYAHFAQLQPELEALAKQELEAIAAQHPAPVESSEPVVTEIAVSQPDEEPESAGNGESAPAEEDQPAAPDNAEPSTTNTDVTAEEPTEAEAATDTPDADASDTTETAVSEQDQESDQVQDESQDLSSDQDDKDATSLGPTNSDITASLRAHSPIRRLRFALCAGRYADLNVLSSFADHLGCPVATAYGTAESAGIITINPTHFDASNPDSLGLPISGLEIEIRGDDGTLLLPNKTGEIWVRGPNVFAGYENGESQLNEDGWFATSDLGHIDDNHWLYLTSRKEDRILRGGFAIYPQDVEAVLSEHEEFEDVAVVARPDSNLGQEVVAFVVPKRDYVPDDREMLEFCTSRNLPKYMAPTLYMKADSIPRSSNGYVLRRELRDRLHGGA
ncbi:AMP-binding protein [bacterium]|nr:AMP-binding protein [bacterium]